MSRRGLFRDTASGVIDDGLTPVALATTSDLAGYQPLDSDLTAIAALTTTSFGRALLALADAAALRTDAGLVIGTDVEAHDPDLTAIAALTPTNDDILQRKAGAWTNRTMAQLIADLAALGTTFQPLDSDLTAIAALSTTTFGRSLLTAADAAAARTALGLGTAATHATGDYDAAGAAAAAQAASQPLDSDLTAIAALDSSTSGAIASDGAGWIKKTYAQFKTALTLVKADVGLGSVDNTADSAKSVAAAAVLTTARTIDGVSFNGSANITTLAEATHAATSKTTPTDADELPLVDSAASSVLKKLTWGNLVAKIQALTDARYPSGSGTSSGTNTGDQTITLTGDVTGSGTGSFAASIGSGKVTSAMIADGTVANADLANMAAKTVKMRHTNSTGAPEDTSMADLWADLSGQAAADVAMNTHKLTGVVDPTAAQDAATKNYVDSGWADDTAETWTYGSADSPTFTFTVTGDLTAKYTVGTRLKLTQTTVKYFIVTAVSVAAGTTTVTIYGGTDYTLANAAVSANYHSYAKAPPGFPTAPSKWTVDVIDTAARAQSGPAANTVYNLGSLTITLPIGFWQFDFHILLDFTKSNSSGGVLGRCGISTANNTFSDLDLIGGAWAPDAGGTPTSNPRMIASISRLGQILRTTKATYYLVAAMNTAGSDLEFRGDLAMTRVRAICGYL